MNGALSLLLDFHALPRVERASTFMEIAGYPHYENVCSNILKFYFDPTAEHGLGDLFLKSFFGMAGVSGLEFSGELAIERECPALDDKRIDLVVEGETFILAIENKIYHWEANDFVLYAGTIDARGVGKQVVKAVLCLNTRAGDPAPKGGFVRFTYRELWKRVRDELGHRLTHAAPKWLTFLNEFMETTSRLAGETQEEREVTDFFMRHHDQIEKLVEDRQRLLNRLHTCLRNIRDSVVSLPEAEKYKTVRGLCGPGVLAGHFLIQGKTIGFDLTVDLKGWTLMIWQQEPHDVIHLLRESAPMKALFPLERKNGNNFTLRQWDLHATEVELRETLVEGYKALIAAADTILADMPTQLQG